MHAESIPMHPMKFDTVIFDMDGLLIDSESLWFEAAVELFRKHGCEFSTELYLTTIGMRSKEFLIWWFKYFNITRQDIDLVNQELIDSVIQKVRQKGKALPGVEHIFNYFIQRKFKMGIATSSPLSLVDVVVEKLGIRDFLHAVTSAHELPLAKPHPQVYLNCAEMLQSSSSQCICFEDSFNGLIAVKAAGMKCIAVPSAHDSKDLRFHAADLKISSLQNFNDLLLNRL